MKLTMFQVRWDWTDTTVPEPSKTSAKSDWCVGVAVDDGLNKAREIKHGIHLQEDIWSDHGIEIENLRIVKVTEEVVE